MAVLILKDMVVPLQVAGNAWQIGYDRGQLAEVQAVDTHGEVLLHRRVLVFGVELQTCIVVGDEIDFRLYLVAFSKEDVIVFVQVEFLVTDGRTVGHQLETYTFTFHFCRGTDADAHTLLVVIVAQAGKSAVLMQVTVNQGVEHELRITAVVADLTLIGQTFTSLCEVQTDGVDTGAVIDERVEMTLTIDACYGRGGEVEEQFLELDVAGFQQVGNRVVALALHMKFHGGQESFDGRLVDDSLLKLCDGRVGELRELLQKTFITTAAIKFYNKIAALSS